MWICYCIYEWVVSFTTVGHNATFTQSQLTVVNNATLWWHKCCVVHNSVSSQCCVWWHNECEMWVVWMLRYSQQWVVIVWMLRCVISHSLWDDIVMTQLTSHVVRFVVRCDDTTNVRCELCECCVIHNSELWLWWHHNSLLCHCIYEWVVSFTWMT